VVLGPRFEEIDDALRGGVLRDDLEDAVPDQQRAAWKRGAMVNAPGLRADAKRE